MKSLILSAVAILALSMPALAAEDQAQHIDELAQAVLEGDGTALGGLYNVATDEDTDPACRRYADTALAAFVLIDAAVIYPQSASLKLLFDFAMDALPVIRNDCRLAI